VFVLVQQVRAVDFGQLYAKASATLVGLAVACSLFPLLGAAMGLFVLCPVRLPALATVAAQTAASFANIVTPAGSGGFALLTRYIRRQRVPTAQAVATVAVAQGTAVMWSLAAFIVAAVATGRNLDLTKAVSTPLIVGTLAALGLLAGALALPSVRGKSRLVANGLRVLQDSFRQIWDMAIRHPLRLAAGALAGLIVLLGSALTLWTCVRAYGEEIPLTSVILVLTVGIAFGTITPVPGGVGTTETGLAAGLALCGIEPLTALLAAVLYRLITFWARVPIGWVCLLWLRRVGHL
jgi:uncharacterized protein (TIRG00374 family)